MGVALFEQELEDLLFGRRVQVARGFVREDQLRGGDQGAGDGDTLAFALRELARATLKEPFDPEVSRETSGSDVRLPVEVEIAMEPVRVENVLQDVDVFEEQEVLENEPEVRDAKGTSGGR